MNTHTDQAGRRAVAFEALRDLVVRWRAENLSTTTAGLTSTLIREGVLVLADLGLGSNREFWEQAEQAGAVVRSRLPNGHWYVLTPGEQPPADGHPPTKAAAPTHTNAVPLTQRRLKRDVWTSFVDWDTSYRRFWDRRRHRAFMTPTETGWAPSSIDPTTYVEIDPAPQDIQILWMQSFADRQDTPHRESLRAALDDDAPRGTFRNRLDFAGLHTAWRTDLAEHVSTLVSAWAHHNDVDLDDVFEDRPRATAHRGPRPDRREAGVPDTTPSPAGRPDPAEALRARVHRIVDAMTWGELCDLPVRAEHLLEP